MCSKRRVKIKLDVRDYVKVMETLGVLDKGNGSDIREFTVEIEDKKSNYEFLTKSGEVLDWDVLPNDPAPGTITWEKFGGGDYITNPAITPLPIQPYTVTCNNNTATSVAGDTSITQAVLNTGTAFATATVDKVLSWEEEKSLIKETIKAYFDTDNPTPENLLTVLKGFHKLKQTSPGLRLTHKVFDREVVTRFGGGSQAVVKLPTGPDLTDESFKSFLGGYNSESWDEVLDLVHSAWNRVSKDDDLSTFISKIYGVKF